MCLWVVLYLGLLGLMHCPLMYARLSAGSRVGRALCRIPLLDGIRIAHWFRRVSRLPSPPSFKASDGAQVELVPETILCTHSVLKRAIIVSSVVYIATTEALVSGVVALQSTTLVPKRVTIELRHN